MKSLLGMAALTFFEVTNTIKVNKSDTLTHRTNAPQNKDVSNLKRVNQ